MISYLGYMQAVMLPPLCSIVYKFLEGRFMTLVGTFSLNILWTCGDILYCRKSFNFGIFRLPYTYMPADMLSDN